MMAVHRCHRDFHELKRKKKKLCRATERTYVQYNPPTFSIVFRIIMIWHTLKGYPNWVTGEPVAGTDD